MSLYKRSNPFTARLTTKYPLGTPECSKETLHVELSLASDQDPLTFEPGDSLGILPRNDPRLVNTVLQCLGAQTPDPELKEKLVDTCNITLLRKSFLTKYQAIASHKELGPMLEDAPATQAYVESKELIDLLTDFPASISLHQLLNILPRLQPRLYSVASSLNKHPACVHLTVGVIRYPRKGVASTWIADYLETGDPLNVYPCPNKRFHLPLEPAPIIMIGPGTGIAPFRAFLQELSVAPADAPHGSFGEQHEHSNFYYQDELEAWIRESTLSKLTTAFSRDQAHTLYVQDRLKEHVRDLGDWIEKGAYLYVCGDAHSMAPAVHQALCEIVSIHFKLKSEEAEAFMKNLKEQGRYRRDVY